MLQDMLAIGTYGAVHFFKQNLRDEDIVERDQSAKIVIVDNLWTRVVEEILLLLLVYIQPNSTNLTILQSTVRFQKLAEEKKPKVLLVWEYFTESHTW